VRRVNPGIEPFRNIRVFRGPSVRRGSRELRTDGQQRDEPDQHPVSPAQIRSRRAKRLLSIPGRVFGTHKLNS